MKTSDLYIITGGSKGLGLSLIRLLINQGHHVACLSRSQPPLESDHLAWVQTDLSQCAEFSDLETTLPTKDWTSVTLVNNAGVVEPIVSIERIESEGLKRNINTNLIGPILLTSWFLKFFKSTPRKRIVNLSTGAATNPLAGWAAYSAAKAGLENFSKTLIDEYREDTSVQVINFNPGIVDTNMQAQIRESDIADFPELERFKEFKKDSHLRPPETVANALLTGLESQKTSEFLSINDLI